MRSRDLNKQAERLVSWLSMNDNDPLALGCLPAVGHALSLPKYGSQFAGKVKRGTRTSSVTVSSVIWRIQSVSMSPNAPNGMSTSQRARSTCAKAVRTSVRRGSDLWIVRA